jgi:hypothetical protein
MSKTSAQKSAQNAVWLKTLHQWHWISSALCLIGMLLFAVTGITLNHASQIEAKPVVSAQKAVLPGALQAALQTMANKKPPPKDAPLPRAVSDWLAIQMGIGTEDKGVEWSSDEAYVALPRPGGDAWVRIAVADGAVEYELTDRGWLSWLNDLHKGRHTGVAWSWFIDVFAGACLVFCLTGLLILKFHAANRPSTWPMVGFGLLLPALLALLFIH